MDLHVGHVIHLKEILAPKSTALIPVMKFLTSAIVAMSAQKLKEPNERCYRLWLWEAPKRVSRGEPLIWILKIHSDKAKNVVDIMEWKVNVQKVLFAV